MPSERSPFLTFVHPRAPRAFVVMLLSMLVAATTEAQRVRYTINEGWRFDPGGMEFAENAKVIDDAGWERVNLPHTWNAADIFDDVPSYRRGVSWYRKRLALPDSLRGRRLALHFEGANQVAHVYVNGAFVGSHAGGYTAFTVDFTKWARFDGKGNEQLVAVQVDNSHHPHIPPLSVGFGLYGGIYRDAWLVATDPVHVTLADHGASGVYVTTPSVSHERAEVQVRTTVVNEGSGVRAVRVAQRVLDAEGREVARGAQTIRALAAGREGVVTERLPIVQRPRLWSPEDPYLYTVVTEVWDGERLADHVESPLGFRWFRFTPDSGFFLNGAKYVLRGTNRHQDMAGLGSALTNRQHVRDLEWIKEMGANFLRLAHYPQDPAVLDAADRLGLLVWEEIPVVNYITVADPFYENAHRMMREMIRQHHNHPSVVMWGTMNEVFLWGEQGERLGRITDTTYRRQVREFARHLDDLTRREDPARYTTMAIHGSTVYDSSGVADVPQVLGLNLYNGWYSGTIDEFGRVLDRRRREHPKHVIFISEYGSGSDLRLNTDRPERFD
ncbi:MAG TPA: glycoside hydrolase family 2 TIM barrel-domain containing protein, partial [Gemmatimonadaceae bacterium]|nr:glycoside hydrolase family 2 TIM barrel-domain containing protein [Gemmatimonadaceae bacterium]